MTDLELSQALRKISEECGDVRVSLLIFTITTATITGCLDELAKHTEKFVDGQVELASLRLMRSVKDRIAGSN